MTHPHDPIARFLESPAYGVVGASPHRHKYGNKVLRCYQQNGRRAIPVNPNEREEDLYVGSQNWHLVGFTMILLFLVIRFSIAPILPRLFCSVRQLNNQPPQPTT